MKVPTSFRLPEEVSNWLKQRAKENRRSISAESIVIFESTMKKEKKLQKK